MGGVIGIKGVRPLARPLQNARSDAYRRSHDAAGPGPGGIEMFLLSVLFMTGWVVAVMQGIAGNYAHLLGLAAVTAIILKGDRRHARRLPKEPVAVATA